MSCLAEYLVDHVRVPETPPGVHLVMIRRPDSPGRTVAVRGMCSCGAQAFKAFPKPHGATVEQMIMAASLLVADTRERCKSGRDLAPGCERQRRWKKAIRAAGDDQRTALALVVP